MSRTYFLLPSVLLLSLLLQSCIGCGVNETPAERQRAANTTAGKMGQVAHKAAVQADKASRVIGRQLGQAARDAHEGWKQDARTAKSGKTNR